MCLFSRIIHTHVGAINYASHSSSKEIVGVVLDKKKRLTCGGHRFKRLTYDIHTFRKAIRLSSLGDFMEMLEVQRCICEIH